jgi:hypothetical protein
MSKNRIEEELNATRIKLYEATKDMTRSERVAYSKTTKSDNILLKSVKKSHKA